MSRPIPYRVRVMLLIEGWVAVDADGPLQAEALAVASPGVQSVFKGSAVRADRIAVKDAPAGVLDDLEG